MTFFNDLMTAIFDVFSLPLRGFAPLVGLVVISAAAGVLLLLLFKVTSPQRAIRRVKDRIKASLLEIRLFKDDLAVLSRAIGRLFLREIPFYMGCCAIPLVPLVVVVLPLLVQLDARYGFHPMSAGDRFLLEATVAEGVDLMDDPVALELPEGLQLEAGPVRIPKKGELAYRIKVQRSGRHQLALRVGNQSFTKTLDASGGHSPIATARVSASRPLDAFFNPIEAAWPADSPMQAMSIRGYTRASMLGIDGEVWPWLWIFCIVGLAAGFALKGTFRVNI